MFFWKLSRFMDEEDKIYTLKVISIHYHGNIMDSNTNRRGGLYVVN